MFTLVHLVEETTGDNRDFTDDILKTTMPGISSIFFFKTVNLHIPPHAQNYYCRQGKGLLSAPQPVSTRVQTAAGFYDCRKAETIR